MDQTGRASDRTDSQISIELIVAVICLVVVMALCGGWAAFAGNGAGESHTLGPKVEGELADTYSRSDEYGVWMVSKVPVLPSPEGHAVNGEPSRDGNDLAMYLSDMGCDTEQIVSEMAENGIRIASVADLMGAMGLDESGMGAWRPEYRIEYEDGEDGSWDVTKVSDQDDVENLQAMLDEVRGLLARYDEEFFEEYDLIGYSTDGSVLEQQFRGASTDGDKITLYFWEEELEPGEGIVALVVRYNYLVAIPKDTPGDAVQVYYFN